MRQFYLVYAEKGASPGSGPWLKLPTGEPAKGALEPPPDGTADPDPDFSVLVLVLLLLRETTPVTWCYRLSIGGTSVADAAIDMAGLAVRAKLLSPLYT